MDNKIFKSIDLNMINKKSSIFVSTEEALKDVEKIKWNDDVVNGNEKVEIVYKG